MKIMKNYKVATQLTTLPYEAHHFVVIISYHVKILLIMLGKCITRVTIYENNEKESFIGLILLTTEK